MKFISKKVIKGHGYYYLQYEKYGKNIGNALPENIKTELINFFENVALDKNRNLPEKVKSAFPYNKLNELENEHYWFVCISENELFRRQFNDFMFWFTVYFTFNSNRAEGSKVTRPEIEKFAFSKKRKPRTRTDREIFNSFNALKYAFSKEMKWNLKHIRRIHEILLKDLDEPSTIGKWKNENNVAPGNQSTADFKKVREEMESLMVWFKAEIGKNPYPPLLALRFYLRFEKIHPFLDGNGRVGRILLNSILLKFKYMPVIFFTRNHKSHCEAIKQALEGRANKINKHFLEQSKKTFLQMRQTIKKEENI
ncbi:Fic family protein [Patescibacteria group bacterium]|nr:Fic family protein [Patescibacteria group bacterium]